MVILADTLPAYTSASQSETGVSCFMRTGLFLLGVAVAVEEGNETACRSLGFAPSLLCSSCSKLGEFVGTEDVLVGECKGCCAGGTLF